MRTSVVIVATLLAASPRVDAGLTTRVSVPPDHTQANGASYEPLSSTDLLVPGRPALSADGCVVAFASEATNLVPGDTNGEDDIFVHDCATGATTRVSVASDGSQANHRSFNPTISADGRFVAFHSCATNLGETGSC